MRTALFIMTAIILGLLVQAARPVLSDRVVSVQHRDDKNFDVVCKNRKSEVVSDLDLKLDNVCPRKVDLSRFAVTAIDYRADGDFNVICQNHELKVASRKQILTGTLCASISE